MFKKCQSYRNYLNGLSQKVFIYESFYLQVLKKELLWVGDGILSFYKNEAEKKIIIWFKNQIKNK